MTTVEQLPIRRRRGTAFLAVTIAGTAVVAAAAWYFLRPGGPVTVSVMLLGSVGGDSTQAALAEGFSDDIATELGKVPWVRVVSRSGVRNYRGQVDIDPQAIGGALGARYLIMGSLRDLDGRRTVTIQLISSENGSQLWSDLFDRTTDLAEIRNQVVRTIGDTLRPQAGREFRAQVAVTAPVHHSTNEAYYLYLQGKEKLNRRGQDVGASVALFREAIALDSLSAEAWSGLSLALALTPRLRQLSPVPFTAEARTAARRALLLNSKLSEPHVALAMVLEYALEWDRAESEFKAALELDRHDVEARVQYGSHLRIRGRLAESLRQCQLAREDDPVSAVVASHLSWAWYLSGQLDSALAETARAWRIDSSNITTITLGAQVLRGAGQTEEAHRRILRLPPTNPLALYVLAATGDRATVMQRLQILESAHPASPRAHSARALAMFGFGDTTQALDALERAIDANEMWFWGGVPKGPIFAGVRSSARFRALLSRVGLSQK